VELLFLGGGRMGAALIAGLIGHGHPLEPLAVVEHDPARRSELASLFPGLRVESDPLHAETVVVCTKPGDVADALSAAFDVGFDLVVSIAAGVTTKTIESTVGAVPVVRAMPNTPAVLGAGATAIAAGLHADAEHLDVAEALLCSVGTVVRVEESLLDAVTAVSGSGPAYVYLLAEHLTAAGVELGLPPDLAEALVGQTLLGASRMLVETAEPAATLRAAVTSPGGTTEAAIAAFDDGRFDALIDTAVSAAARRSAERGTELEQRTSLGEGDRDAAGGAADASGPER